MKVVFAKDEPFSLDALADKIGVPNDPVDELDEATAEDVEIDIEVWPWQR